MAPLPATRSGSAPEHSAAGAAHPCARGNVATLRQRLTVVKRIVRVLTGLTRQAKLSALSQTLPFPARRGGLARDAPWPRVTNPAGKERGLPSWNSWAG